MPSIRPRSSSQDRSAGAHRSCERRAWPRRAACERAGSTPGHSTGRGPLASGRLGERTHRRQRAEETLVIREDRLDSRLLEHGLAHPDGIGIGGPSPRQIAPLALIPFEQARPEPLARPGALRPSGWRLRISHASHVVAGNGYSWGAHIFCPTVPLERPSNEGESQHCGVARCGQRLGENRPDMLEEPACHSTRRGSFSSKSSHRADFLTYRSSQRLTRYSIVKQALVARRAPVDDDPIGPRLEPALDGDVVIAIRFSFAPELSWKGRPSRPIATGSPKLDGGIERGRRHDQPNLRTGWRRRT